VPVVPLVAEAALVLVVPVVGAVPDIVPIVSVPVDIVPIVSVPVDIVLEVSVMVVDEVSVVLVVAEVSVTVVSVTLVFDSFLQAKANRATAAMVRKTRSVFFIVFSSRVVGF
jgi:hypothetical protein